MKLEDSLLLSSLFELHQLASSQPALSEAVREKFVNHSAPGMFQVQKDILSPELFSSLVEQFS